MSRPGPRLDPEVPLAQADRLLRGEGVADLRGSWPRICAWLLRLAVEQAVDEVWRAHGRPELMRLPMRAQLLLLPAFVDGAAADEVGSAWYALSRAGHLHAYELAPTAAELRRWHQDLRTLLPRLAQPEPTPPNGMPPNGLRPSG
ncbi:hypothetical protein CC117_06505 [Parafrankia colletiae]|uniref:Uncharacterized protein n=1 Tax=Parafrankia colletiae TaxID=573497 RepID=A0A1S1Q6T5_9ACTN|nr:hypothetical protein [Parafrankia colletiae]MCK9903698.1 hypothetical protein [Frankia sp. Cpl3]OHV30583.1 hypothetical protein CC117_06505 [Parafrankia colletiae]